MCAKWSAQSLTRGKKSQTIALSLAQLFQDETETVSCGAASPQAGTPGSFALRLLPNLLLVTTGSAVAVSRRLSESTLNMHLSWLALPLVTAVFSRT